MVLIYDVDPTELIEKLSEELKKIEHIKPPVWSSFVKTGMHKERPPVKRDWWYTRAASVLRYVQIRGPIGVHKLRIKYGGKKNRGVATEHFYKSSGNIIRKVLQQLEKAELVKQVKSDIHKGRIITPKGIALLNNVVKSMLKGKKAEKQDIVKEIKEKAVEMSGQSPETSETQSVSERLRNGKAISKSLSNSKKFDKKKAEKPKEEKKPEVKEVKKEEPKK